MLTGMSNLIQSPAGVIGVDVILNEVNHSVTACTVSTVGAAKDSTYVRFATTRNVRLGILCTQIGSSYD